MKPSLTQIGEAVDALAELVPFFPKVPIAHKVIIAEIYRFVASEEQLTRFIETYVRKVPKYESVPQLRAVFYSLYAPADGVAPTVDVPGFTADDLEAEYRMREMADNERRLEEYRRQAQLAPPEDREPFLLPEGTNKMPELKKVIN